MNGYQRLGDWLVQKGHLTETQRDRAIATQKESGARFGEVLLALGFVSEKEICLCLSEQYDLPICNLTEARVSPEALTLVTPTFALSSLLLPLSINETEFHCVIADPLAIGVTDELTKALHRRLVLSLAGSRELYEKIALSYGLAEARIHAPARQESERESTAPLPPSSPLNRMATKKARGLEQEDRRYLLAALSAVAESSWEAKADTL
ncbi:MAG: hypothetical protein MUC92_11395 [Fimbriimonadaceae bacterium]|jgi:type IV pilus assembly protein PilB|nr:hypothetical protein [Fimbriimonadaceae bacterium]